MSMLECLLRLWPYVWPYRRKLLISIGFATIVALLWGTNLSVIYPVATILLDQQGLPEHIHNEVLRLEDEVQHEAELVQKYEERMNKLAGPQHTPVRASAEFVDAADKRADHQALMATAGRSLVFYKWCDATIVPWLPRDSFRCFALILIALVFATLIKGACLYIQEFLVGEVVQLTMMDLRKACYRKSLKLDYQTLQQEGVSGLMSRFTFDLQLTGNGLSLLGGKIVLEPLKAIACMVLAFCVSWQLTLLSLLAVPLAAFTFHRFGKLIKSASHRMMESMSRIYKSLEETFAAQKIVIAYDNLRSHRVRFHRENREFERKAIKIVKIDALTSPCTELFGIVAITLALMPCAYLVLRQETSIWGIKLASSPPDFPTLMLLYGLLVGVIDPVRKLSSVYSKLKRSAAAADRVLELLRKETQVVDPAHPIILPRHQQTIEFRDVSFSYRQGKSAGRGDALRNVNLTVQQGEFVLVVGENGSGKSTLVNLLPRYFDVDHGSVLIDGIDIRQVRLSQLRGQLAVVTQETLLFDTTIAENIRYGNPLANRDQIIEAAHRANLLSFVEQLPEGFDTVVGEKGGNLSGGQRQRIALARAFIRNPAILILDEATSAIDAQSESLIYEALRSFSARRTVFAITHAVSPALRDMATRVILMEQGALAADGTHAEVLAGSRTYQRLFQAQTDKRAA